MTAKFRYIVKKHVSLLIFLSLILLCSALSAAAMWQANDAMVSADKQLLKNSNELADMRLKLIKDRKQEEAKKIAAAEAAEAEKQKNEAEAAARAQKPQQSTSPALPAGCSFSGPHSDPNQADVIVNKKHCLTPLSYVPPDLQTVYGATLSAKASGAFSAMYEAAAAAGVPFQTSSSYRSYNNQVSTYNYWVQTNGSVAAADTVSARPGYSEHQTGLAADLSVGSCVLDCFAGSAQYQWLLVHGADYGFIERYPRGYESITGYSPEAWHWRYVGVSIAQAMKASGVRTLEQYYGIEGGDYR